MSRPDVTTFEALLASRNAADYADFLLPYLTPDSRVLDVGCGTGTITLGLAEKAAIRERMWQLENAADPHRGRQLRGLFERAGFGDVVATSKYFCYGTSEAVRSFGRAKAEDCRESWYARLARERGITTERELDLMSRAWLKWSESPTAYAAFAWCRAVGRKPSAT